MSDPSIPAPGSSSADSTGAAAGPAGPPGSVILEMRDITKEFPGVKALSNVSMAVRRGEIHAICGENGAGKSTLMKVLSGVLPRGTYDGEIHFEGQLCEFNNIRDSEHAGIVIIHQELALIPELSIAENIFLGNETTKRRRHQLARHPSQARELLARVGLEEDPDTKISDIGVGKQQLVEIAKALVQGRQAAHPRRADRRAQRGRLPAPARPHRAGCAPRASPAS